MSTERRKLDNGLYFTFQRRKGFEMQHVDEISGKLTTGNRTIGTMTGLVVPSWVDGIEIGWDMDCHSAHAIEFADKVLHLKEQDDDLLYMSSLEVEPKWQNRGYGRMIYRLMIEGYLRFGGQPWQMVYHKPFPLDEDKSKSKEWKERLKNFYRRMGFNDVKRHFQGAKISDLFKT